MNSILFIYTVVEMSISTWKYLEGLIMTTNKNISKNSVFEATKKSGKFSNRVSHFVFSDGERYPMLLDVDGRPDYWTTLYITETRRTSVLQNTIERTHTVPFPACISQ